MGAAKRRRELGIMPEPTQKPRKTTRIKADHNIGYTGIGGMAAILGTLMMSSHVGRNFAMRSEMARMNRELDRPSGLQSD